MKSVLILSSLLLLIIIQTTHAYNLSFGQMTAFYKGMKAIGPKATVEVLSDLKHTVENNLPILSAVNANTFSYWIEAAAQSGSNALYYLTTFSKLPKAQSLSYINQCLRIAQATLDMSPKFGLTHEPTLASIELADQAMFGSSICEAIPK